jgi:hypothetical protein
MSKPAVALMVLIVFGVFEPGCSTGPPPQQPTPGPMKGCPVDEASRDSGSGTADVDAKTGDHRGSALGTHDARGGLAVSFRSAYDQYPGMGQGAWGRRRGSTRTSAIIVIVIVVACVVGLLLMFGKHHFI